MLSCVISVSQAVYLQTVNLQAVQTEKTSNTAESFQNINISQTISNQETNTENNSCTNKYDVYNQAITRGVPSYFDEVMCNNPIDITMQNDDSLANSLYASTATGMVSFYNKYYMLWKLEMKFSINILKQYLSDDEIIAFDEAQTAWLLSYESNMDFERSLYIPQPDGDGIFVSRDQYETSLVLYMISQYRDRTIHIKYLIYEIENNPNELVPEADQLWNKFQTLLLKS